MTAGVVSLLSVIVLRSISTSYGLHLTEIGPAFSLDTLKDDQTQNPSHHTKTQRKTAPLGQQNNRSPPAAESQKYLQRSRRPRSRTTCHRRARRARRQGCCCSALTAGRRRRRLGRKSLRQLRGAKDALAVALVQARRDGRVRARAGRADGLDAARKHVKDVGGRAKAGALVRDVVAARGVGEADRDQTVEDAGRLGGDGWEGGDGVRCRGVGRGCWRYGSGGGTRCGGGGLGDGEGEGEEGGENEVR